MSCAIEVIRPQYKQLIDRMNEAVCIDSNVTSVLLRSLLTGSHVLFEEAVDGPGHVKAKVRLQFALNALARAIDGVSCEEINPEKYHSWSDLAGRNFIFSDRIDELSVSSLTHLMEHMSMAGRSSLVDGVTLKVPEVFLFVAIVPALRFGRGWTACDLIIDRFDSRASIAPPSPEQALQFSLASKPDAYDRQQSAPAVMTMEQVLADRGQVAAMIDKLPEELLAHTLELLQAGLAQATPRKAFRREDNFSFAQPSPCCYTPRTAAQIVQAAAALAFLENRSQVAANDIDRVASEFATQNPPCVADKGWLKGQ